LRLASRIEELQQQLAKDQQNHLQFNEESTDLQRTLKQQDALRLVAEEKLKKIGVRKPKIDQ